MHLREHLVVVRVGLLLGKIEQGWPSLVRPRQVILDVRRPFFIVGNRGVKLREVPVLLV